MTNINEVYAGKYKALHDDSHDKTKPVTINFGNIRGDEKHLVLADLFLPMVTKEVDVDSLQIFCYYRNEKNVPTKTNPLMFRVKRCSEPKETSFHAKLVEIAKHELLNTTGPIISKLGPYGSQLKETFSMTLEGKDSIKEVTITYGFIVDAIQFLIKKPNGRIITHSFGGKGGEHKKKVTLKRNEYITQISGKYGNYIHQNNDLLVSSLNIHTNICPSGYGLCGYQIGVRNITSFSSPIPTNGPIVGFWGRYRNYLESIGIFVRKDC